MYFVSEYFRVGCLSLSKGIYIWFCARVRANVMKCAAHVSNTAEMKTAYTNLLGKLEKEEVIRKALFGDIRRILKRHLEQSF